MHASGGARRPLSAARPIGGRPTRIGDVTSIEVRAPRWRCGPASGRCSSRGAPGRLTAVARAPAKQVSEEALSSAGDFLPVSLAEPNLSVWLHWGAHAGKEVPPDLDLSAVCFDSKARPVDVVFFRNLDGRHAAVTHLGDDADAAASEQDHPCDAAARTRRREGLVVQLPRLDPQAPPRPPLRPVPYPQPAHVAPRRSPQVVAVVVCVTCFSAENGSAPPPPY